MTDRAIEQYLDIKVSISVSISIKIYLSNLNIQYLFRPYSGEIQWISWYSAVHLDLQFDTRGEGTLLDPKALYFCSILDIWLTFHKVKIENSLTNYPVEKFRICAPGMGGANKARNVRKLWISWRSFGTKGREDSEEGAAAGVEN